MVSRAVRENWDVPGEKRGEIVDRLLKVVEKQEVEVMTKEGVVAIDGPADVNAVRAARVLVAMDALNQTDYWNQDKNDRLDAARSTENVGIEPVILRQPISSDIVRRLTGG
jgi:hypothetical protein